jgi:prophage DNA circulation protein
MADVLTKLFALRWREVEIPYTRLRTSIAHDLVEHKYWGVDGARIEDTGMAPIRVSATIPLQNGVDGGINEYWDPELYPKVMRKLLTAFTHRQNGPLRHPEFGTMVCKAEKLELDWDAMKRGGCDAEATWVETIDERVTRQLDPSPAANAEFAAQSLADIKALVDAQLKARGLRERTPEFKESFESMMNNITGVVDQVGLTAKRITGRVDAIAYRVTALGDSIGRAKTALSWPATEAVERLKSVLNDTRVAINKVVDNKRIALYVVPADTTFAGITRQLPGARLIDLMRLNPGLMRQASVPKGTVVRYYREALAA